MVLGEAAAFTAAGAHALFGYNRENYMYDRKQRQEMEFKVLEWRSTQAELWRDDVREVIGLTEKKMDTYLIVNTLQLGMCVGLYAEGRLEPGTPPWLLHLYMLTLSAAFMYLLMSVWLAMHASVVASCSSVRLLTQFVRLPVPTWQQLEAMRTYAQTVESLEPSQLLRVPFTGRGRSPSTLESKKENARVPPTSSVSDSKADPWGLELHGDLRSIYELAEQPAELRRHICLAQRAAKQYQAFDAFARVCMSFGTTQLLNALCYYVLGYVAVQDGAPFPACCVVIIMAGIALGLVHLDFALNAKELLLARILICVGPVNAAIATFIWAFHHKGSETLVTGMLPFTYGAHGLWLFFALTTCGLQIQPNGAVLPTRFRAILYLDVFGWLPQSRLQTRQEHVEASAAQGGLEPSTPGVPEVSPEKKRQNAADRNGRRVQWTETESSAAPKGSKAPQDTNGSPVTPLLRTPQRARAASPSAPAKDPEPGPSGELRDVPGHAFAAASYAVLPPEAETAAQEADVEIITGHDKMDPGRAPAKVFRIATTMLIMLWAAGLALPMGIFREFMTKPLTADVFVEEMSHKDHPTERSSGRRHHEGQRSRMRGSLAATASRLGDDGNWPTLGEGQVLQASWPSHSGFVPRSLSCDPTGKHLVVADDLGVYQGRVVWEDKKMSVKKKENGTKHSPSAHEETQATHSKDIELPKRVLGVEFERSARCNELEGQNLEDISMICTGEGGKQTCRVVVLHARGRRLAQCPLPLTGEKGSDTKPSGNESLTTWTISSDWLHGGRSKKSEHVESFAVNSECMDRDDVAPSREVGCVVVGTTSGRIVQLKGAYQDRSRLVPERSMRQRERSVSRGSLHVFPSGLVVALRRHTSTLEAFNGALGTKVGTWQLPSGIDWLMVCGGGDSLYVLGLGERRHKELHRFPMPDELKAATAPDDSVQSVAEASRRFAVAGRVQEA